jgi:putative DNA primase/helicase
MNTEAVNGDGAAVLPFPTRGEVGYAPQFSEEGMALAFAKKYRSSLRYVHSKRRWMEWNGTRWVEENTLRPYDLIRQDCRAAAAIANGEEEYKKAVGPLSSAKTRTAIETIARSDRRLAATADQWDSDDWLLNTPGGIIDLRTGQNIGHDPLKYCKNITAVAPGEPGEVCPIWLAFLDRAMDKNQKLIDYIQRMCGYFITGSVREHALFFLYGTGRNGKGVFLNTVSAITHMYHVVSSAQTFAEQKQQRHETEIAKLYGPRLVISQETEQGQYWAESRIKSMTGGDRLTGRFMHGDYFDFDPKFKLCIVGNHKPRLRAVDAAIRGRFNLIPFTVTIPPEERDKNLSEKLKAEWPAILRWMIAGCLEWQRQGLNPPEEVLAATEDYLDSEDNVGTWLFEMCVTPDSYRDSEMRYQQARVQFVGSAEVKQVDLFNCWKTYAEERNIPAKASSLLADQLVAKGFKRDKDKRGNGSFEF